ncbi:MAG TPA: endonuclease [Candidatus Zambryskibacteria bacterium]|nr:endonuclease [Candidatus Zambryskibacteria bacterium]
MAYTYILLSKMRNKTYVGSTVDLKNRITEHNSGKSTFTKRYIPWQLVYSEEFDSIQEARKREKYFKTAAGRTFTKKYIPR